MKTSGADFTKKTKFHIGTSGWQYWHWRKIIYPEGLKSSDWLNFYSNHFSTVEINVTFYREVRKSTFERWYKQVRSDFLFSVKMSRNITHFKRLRVDKSTVDHFLSGVSNLKDKLGVILIQLPPSFRFESSVIEDFFGLLNHGHKYAIEVRNKTFLNDDFLNILKYNNIALCIADSAGRYPYLEALTSDFVYVRLHGSEKLYASNYSEEELQRWAEKIKNWNKLTFVYFDNDFSGFAFKNALRLKELLTL